MGHRKKKYHNLKKICYNATLNCYLNYVITLLRVILTYDESL